MPLLTKSTEKQDLEYMQECIGCSIKAWSRSPSPIHNLAECSNAYFLAYSQICSLTRENCFNSCWGGEGSRQGCTPALIYELIRASGSLQDRLSQQQVLQRVSEGGITVKGCFFFFFSLIIVLLLCKVCETKVQMLTYCPVGQQDSQQIISISEISYTMMVFSAAAPS